MADERQSVFNAYDQRFRGSIIGQSHPQAEVLGWIPNRQQGYLIQPHEHGTFFTQARGGPVVTGACRGCGCIDNRR